jgi:antitoxin component of RelBE/YafQ-DinJ toxin-antitoxin module
MIIRMRTTLVLDDDLLRQAKRVAAERNVTVSEVVNAALRESLARPPAEAPPFQMITYGRSDRRVHHEPKDFAAAIDDDDRSSLR